MTRQESEAIEKAIVAGITTAIEKILVHPFPKANTEGVVDYSTVLFHAKSAIEGSVRNQLRSVIDRN